tara:strand:- start:517 stop:996 length:480 start_codon:yes stop_codon:yes gene_type:complete
MKKEIEKKFLVKHIPKKLNGFLIKQGYLQRDIKRTIRIRTVLKEPSSVGYLTIKGISNEGGTSRYEFETKIPFKDANDLLNLCDRPLIIKTRYHFRFKGFLWEIDEFHEENAGLLIAEIELSDVNQTFPLPDFIKREVTGEKKYYNSMLIEKPFLSWNR